MSTGQHGVPIVIGADGEAVRPARVSMSATGAGGSYDEAWLRDLLLANPGAIPIDQIDSSFGPLVPLCREIDTRLAGFADLLFVNRLGLLTLIECKLWRNPEARRKVIAQILDYARVLRDWDYADLQREVARARGENGFNLFEHVRAFHPDVDETTFVDAVTRFLRAGRIALLVIGDGIREGVEAIAEYLTDHAGLHFTFGLVELPVFELGDGRRIVIPRVPAKTMIVNRVVVEIARSGEARVVEPDDETESDPARPAEGSNERGDWMREFWGELVASMVLDDAAQPPVKATRLSNVYLMLPVPNGALWITSYFSEKEGGIGVMLSGLRSSELATEICERLFADRAEIDKDIGFPTLWDRKAQGRARVSAFKSFDPLRGAEHRGDQLAWFRLRLNAFVNALRPRVIRARDELTHE